MSTPVTLVGRLASEPEMRFSNAGKPIAKFTIVTSERFQNKETQNWEDRNTTFWRCTAFDQLAENICENLRKGMAVIAGGKAYIEEWTDKESRARQSLCATINSLGEDLRWVKRDDAARTTPKQQAAEFNDSPPF